jgi:hypothetical protein
MIVDYVSMYPTLVKDGGISPECNDYISASSVNTPRFDRIVVVISYGLAREHGQVTMGATVVGVSDAKGETPHGMSVIGDICDGLETRSFGTNAESVIGNWIHSIVDYVHNTDPTLLLLPTAYTRIVYFYVWVYAH